MAEGIRKRHKKGCPARGGGRCRCDGGYEASVFSPRDGKKLYKTFAREPEARSWRAATKRALDRGSLRAGNGKTLEDAATAWLEGASRGDIRSRSGRVYKPATLRGYSQALVSQLVPRLGTRRLSAITTLDLQELVDAWQVEGHAPSTIRNWLKPLQAIYRRARTREGLPINPTHDLELPSPEPTEVEILAPDIAGQLLGALALQDRVIWATALYGGLRYGELRALRWGAVDLAGGTIRVRESWDPKTGSIAPKTRTSQRTTPVPAVLRRHLLSWNEAQAAPPDEQMLFAGPDGSRFMRQVSIAGPTGPGKPRGSPSGCGSTRPATPMPRS